MPGQRQYRIFFGFTRAMPELTMYSGSVLEPHPKIPSRIMIRNTFCSNSPKVKA